MLLCVSSPKLLFSVNSVAPTGFKMHMRLTLEPKVVGSIKKRTKFVNKEKRSWLVLAL